MTQYGLPLYDANILTSSKALADYFENCLELMHPDKAKMISNWLLGDFSRLLNATNTEIENVKIRPEYLAQMLGLVDNGTISGKIDKTVFEDMKATGRMPEDIVRERGLVQITDADALIPVAQEIIEAHPKEAADYRAGKTKVLGFFVGQLMRRTKGQANPQLANEIFQRLLEA